MNDLLSLSDGPASARGSGISYGQQEAHWEKSQKYVWVLLIPNAGIVHRAINHQTAPSSLIIQETIMWSNSFPLVSHPALLLLCAFPCRSHFSTCHSWGNTWWEIQKQTETLQSGKEREKLLVLFVLKTQLEHFLSWCKSAWLHWRQCSYADWHQLRIWPKYFWLPCMRTL